MKLIQLPLLLCMVHFFSNAQPANDDPCGAINIPVNPPDYSGKTCEPSINYSWSSANLTTGLPNRTCIPGDLTNIRDVWYKIVVPASGRIKFGFNSVYSFTAVFYRPENCSNTENFTQAGCFFYTTPNTTEGFELNSLTAGSTIYLRMLRNPTSILRFGSAKICAAEIINNPPVDNSTRVGIGTTNPLAKLDVVGTAIVRDSMSVGKNLEVRESLKVENNVEVKGTVTADQLQINAGAGENKIMVSDANGKGSWKFRDSIYSSGWISSPYSSRDTLIDGTCMKLRHIYIPELTSEVINTKLITVYLQAASVGPFQLPYINEAGNVINQINFVIQPFKILIYRHTFNSCRYNSGYAVTYPGEPLMVELPPFIQYRYVIHY